MKNFKSATLSLLLTRLTILLEFEPCDATQAGYFRHLRELRNRLADSQRETARTRMALSMIERLSAHGKTTK